MLESLKTEMLVWKFKIHLKYLSKCTNKKNSLLKGIW